MDPKNIEKLAKILRDQGDKLLTSEFKFTLTGDLLRSLNDSFSLIIDENEPAVPANVFQVVKPNNSKSNVFRELNFIYDFIQKTIILKLTKFLDDDPLDDDNNCVIDISKFRNLTILEVQRVPIERIIGLQQLRSQLQEIKAERSLTNVKDLIVYCAGDKSNGFIWNSLKRADFSYNQLEKVDSSFEFTPYLQVLNLSHNKIFSISALVWCPNLKVLNLSFNQLTTIPKLNVESYKRLQVLIINDNLIEDISGLVRMDSLLDLDLSGNCLLDHSLLLPLCTCTALRFLSLAHNPLAFHPKHRSATCRYLSKNAATVQFQFDGFHLSKQEKALTGAYENYYPAFGHRMTVSTSSSRATPQTPSTKSISNTPDNSSVGSLSSVNQHSNTSLFGQQSSAKRMKPRCVEIEERATHSRQNEVKSPTNKRLLKEGSKEHLVTKLEIEQLRQQFGSEWLYNQGNVVGLEEEESATARKKLNFGDLLSSSPAHRMVDSFESSDPIESSTPLEDTTVIQNDGSLYKSIDNSVDNSVYASALDETFNVEPEEEIVVSEPEDNEVQFIGTDELTNEELFIVVSDMNIKEKDAMNGRTIAKWGSSTLESVERVKSDLIRLTFDTIRKDKRARQYRMDVKCCQELERILRDYLSSRPLSEMIKLYKCLKCNSQFSRDINHRNVSDIKCPCGNKYVIEIQTSPKSDMMSPPKSSFMAGNLFMPSTASAVPPFMPKVASSISIEKKSDDSMGGISKTSHSFSSIESAFDSNQSVAGSSVEVLSESSSQISQVSHTSQSSIEVLDNNYGSRKPSEERRISQVPSLHTIEDATPKIDEIVLDETLISSKDAEDLMKPKVVLSIGNVNLTESSSSGSVCESVVTAYESAANGRKKEKTSSDEKQAETKLDGIFKSSQNLLKKTPKPVSDSEPFMFTFNAIHYNYEDLSIVDHRVKLYLFQKVLEENDEKLMWLLKSLVLEDDPTTSSGIPYFALLIMSTKKFYVLKIVNEETEDIGNWLKKTSATTIEGIEKIRAMPSKVGYTFVLKSKASFHVLLQDQNVADRLRIHLTTSNQNIEIQESLPSGSNDKLMSITNKSELRSLAIFQSCATSISSATESESADDAPKKNISCGAIIVTVDAIHLTTNFQWLCDNTNIKSSTSGMSLMQPMSNLVELENVTKTSFTLSFMDELENTIEKWRFVFESYPRILSVLTTIDEIWQKIFCVPLINDDQILS